MPGDTADGPRQTVSDGGGRLAAADARTETETDGGAETDGGTETEARARTETAGDAETESAGEAGSEIETASAGPRPAYGAPEDSTPDGPSLEEVPADGVPPDELSGEELLLSADCDVEPTLSFVMPTLNEAGGVAECIESIRNCLAELGEFGEIVVSDSSTDATPEIARREGAIVVEPDEPGYGYAYQYAFEHVRGDYVVIGDADTTYDFEEVPKLYEHVVAGDAELAMGSRLEGEILPGAMPPLHEHVGNPLLTAFLNAFYDAGVSDAHSGLRVVDAGALEGMELQSMGMEFASEMIMEAGSREMTIVEEPITYHSREGEATLDSLSDGWRHVRFMLENAPGYLFSVPGLAMSGLGASLMALAGSGLQLGATNFGIHSMLAGSLLTIVGFQVLSLGAFAYVAGNPILKPEDRMTVLLMENVDLQTGATMGLAVFAVGAGLAVMMLGRWVGSGFTNLPLAMTDVFAFTAIVVGLQTVFNAFFLSAVRE